MAGALMIIDSEHLENSVTAIRDQWRIHFSRFFTNPFLSSTCPSLIPIPQNRRTRRNRGTWISTSSSTASLQILHENSISGAILAVCFNGKILEEHYISKLHFSWPQVSCVSGFPARGSRAVFVSYKDSVGKIQKFALRFSTIYEAEIFINALKEILKDVGGIEPMNSNLGSEISSQSEFMSSNRFPSRASEEETSIATPVHTYSPQMPQCLHYEVEQHSCVRETNHDVEGIFRALPPSFTSLLTSCCSEVKEAAAQQTVSEEVDLRSQIVRYMENSSFQDMLNKVEKIISEMGDDLIL